MPRRWPMACWKGPPEMQQEALAHWPFVIAAYALGLGGTAALIVHSWLAMRRAEARRDAGRNRGVPWG